MVNASAMTTGKSSSFPNTASGESEKPSCDRSSPCFASSARSPSVSRRASRACSAQRGGWSRTTRASHGM